jgi:hypothetical protein
MADRVEWQAEIEVETLFRLFASFARFRGHSIVQNHRQYRLVTVSYAQLRPVTGSYGQLRLITPSKNKKSCGASKTGKYCRSDYGKSASIGANRSESE